MLNICPKCRDQRQSIDHNIHPDICPNCGIVYSKFIAKQTQENLPNQSKAESTAKCEDECVGQHASSCKLQFRNRSNSNYCSIGVGRIYS